MAVQVVKLPFIRAQIARFDTTQLVVSELGGIDNSVLSLALNSHRPLSAAAQRAILKVFEFLEDLAEDPGRPLNFSNIAAMRPCWERWSEAQAQEEIRTRLEIGNQVAARR